MLDQTSGKHSLDEVELALWEQCKDDKPGFEEDDIRRHLVRFGGYQMGTFYDDVVMKPGELPVEKQLAKIGKELLTVDEKFGSVPFSMRMSMEEKVPKVALSEVAEIPQGAVVTRINGVDLTGENARNLTSVFRSLRTAKPGDILKVTLKDGDKTKEVNIKVGEATRKVQRIVSVQNPSERQLKLRKIFEAKRRR
jgi:predicted metalloprotease with PDZ domain